MFANSLVCFRLNTYMNAVKVLIVLAVIAGSAYGQGFDAASIRESDPAAGRAGVRSTIEPNPGSLTVRNTTLREAIRWAYDESVGPDGTGLSFANVTMTDFQQFLSSTRGVNQPVINRTGLEGQFDFKLAILTGADTEEARKAAIGGGNLIVFADALKDVGLRLEPGKVPLDVITIEKAERPSDN